MFSVVVLFSLSLRLDNVIAQPLPASKKDLSLRALIYFKFLVAIAQKNRIR